MQYHWYNNPEGAALLASGSYSGSNDDGDAPPGGDVPPGSASYSSFDDGDGSFLAALRQSKRKSIRQVGCSGLAVGLQTCAGCAVAAAGGLAGLRRPGSCRVCMAPHSSTSHGHAPAGAVGVHAPHSCPCRALAQQVCRHGTDHRWATATPAPPQERKKAAAEGLRFLRLTGDDIKPRHWDAFYDFYVDTTGAGKTRRFF